MEKIIIAPAEAEILDSIRRIVTGGSSLDEVLGALFAEVRKILPCNRLDIGLVEEKGMRVEIRHVAADYEPSEVTKGHVADVPDEIADAIRRDGYLILDDIGRADKGDMSALLAQEGVRSMVIAPVLAGDPIGFITCSSRTSGAFLPGAGRILVEVAKILRFQVEKEFHIDQIENNYQAYMEMLGFVSHELKSPVSSIVTLVTTLSEGYYGKVDEKQKEILQRIVKKAEYLEALTNQYLNLARFESSMMEPNPRLIDFIEDIVEPAIDLLMPRIEERGMRLERNYPAAILPVRCDPDLVKIVMINLLGNGIKYGNRGGALRVSVTKEFKKFMFSVWNEGPGFTEEDKHRLFKKFSRLQAAELIERKGSGIGLYVSWKIVQIHCGRIHAESEHGAWARFTVDLPLYLDLCIME